VVLGRVNRGSWSFCSWFLVMMLVVVLGCRLKMFFLAHGDFFRVYVVGHVFVFHAAVGAWCVCVCACVCVCVCACVAGGGRKPTTQVALASYLRLTLTLSPKP
jgi:hypothetical protein